MSIFSLFLKTSQDNIRLECKKRTIRLTDFFKTFDRMHLGRVSKNQFHRAILLSGIIVSPEEVDLLMTRYEVPAENMPDGHANMVNYKKFCNQIDKVFTIQGLEKDPLKQVKLALEDVGEPILGPENPAITAVESEDLKGILSEFNSHCKNRGYNVKVLFGDFDRNNDGQITNEQFMRNVFVLCPQLSMAHAELVCKAYAAPMGMNYRELHRHCTDINLPDVEDSSLFGRMPKKHTEINIDEETLNEVVTFFSMKIAQTPGIRMADYFVSFDKMKTNTIKTEQFLQGLVRCFGSLTLIQTEALSVKYKNPATGLVDYRAFIKEITEIAGSLAYDRTPGFSQTTILDDKEQEFVKEVLQEMCTKVTKHRIMLKPTFQDFDRRYEDHVSKEQFMRALSMFNLLPQSSYAIDALSLAFSPTSFKHSAGKFVNYRKFLDYIHGIVSKTEREQMALSADAYKDVPRHLRSDFTPGEVADGVEIQVEWSEEEKKGDALEDFIDDFGGMSVMSSPSKISVFTGRAEKSMQSIIDDIRKSVLQNRIR
jgi:Ca2+-binding EF-hand superfamily protein